MYVVTGRGSIIVILHFSEAAELGGNSKFKKMIKRENEINNKRSKFGEKTKYRIIKTKGNSRKSGRCCCFPSRSFLHISSPIRSPLQTRQQGSSLSQIPRPLIYFPINFDLIFCFLMSSKSFCSSTYAQCFHWKFQFLNSFFFLSVLFIYLVVRLILRKRDKDVGDFKAKSGSWELIRYGTP